jgi:hypothetical protein
MGTKFKDIGTAWKARQAPRGLGPVDARQAFR